MGQQSKARERQLATPELDLKQGGCIHIEARRLALLKRHAGECGRAPAFIGQFAVKKLHHLRKLGDTGIRSGRFR